MGHKKTKLNICHHTLTLSTHLQNRSFRVVERKRTSTNCQKMKNERAKRAKILFFIVKYANLWGLCCRRRRGCLSSLMSEIRSNILMIFLLFICVQFAQGSSPKSGKTCFLCLCLLFCSNQLVFIQLFCFNCN